MLTVPGAPSLLDQQLSYFVEASAAADAAAPVLTLRGGPVLTVQQGQLLAAAPGFGATAHDAADGVVTQIRVEGAELVDTLKVRGVGI